MQLSLVGLIVCAALLLVAWISRGPAVVGLVASLAFGSTAAVTLGSLGGASPLIYTLFALFLLMSVASRQHALVDLGGAFGSIGAIWILAGLMLYAVVGAWLFPRLFSGQIYVFVQGEGRTAVIETPLAPVSANISQTGYFLLGGLTAVGLSVLILGGGRLRQLRDGFFLWASLHTAMGLFDLLGKLAGAGDIMQPIRTANYAMLTEVQAGGFFRIAGGYAEASSFGSASLACLAFCYTYWRKTGSLYAMGLAAAVLLLVVLSTSSTAYAGLAVLSIPVAVSVLRSALSGRLKSDEFLIMGLMATGLLVILAAVVYDARLFDPFLDLVNTMVINKASTSSGQERLHWNVLSLEAFMDTNGLGVGFGSSRASSWPVAVLSQLGAVGSVMMAMLLFVLVRGLGGLTPWVDPETDALVTSVRNAALAGLVAAALAGGSADPGMIFFIALAVVSATRAKARQSRHLAPDLAAMAA